MLSIVTVKGGQLWCHVQRATARRGLAGVYGTFRGEGAVLGNLGERQGAARRGQYASLDPARGAERFLDKFKGAVLHLCRECARTRDHGTRGERRRAAVRLLHTKLLGEILAEGRIGGWDKRDRMSEECECPERRQDGCQGEKARWLLSKESDRHSRRRKARSNAGRRRRYAPNGVVGRVVLSPAGPRGGREEDGEGGMWE